MRSIWAYPWDLHDIGLDTALDRIAGAGFDMVSLATSYHAGRFLQPGNPRRRVYFPEDGTVYYRVDPGRWAGAEIAPKQAAIVETEGDMLDALVRRRAAGGPAVSCWTVCLHNTRLGMAHPDHVMRTAHGDPVHYALCPSSPAARAYVTGMVAEIAERYAPDRIELESPDFMGFDHGYHHEKDGLGLMPGESFLLGLCFCAHCTAGAAAKGVDAEAARVVVADRLDQAFARELPLDGGLPEDANLAAFLAWRSTPVTSLVADAKAAGAGVPVLLIDMEGSEAGGVNRAAAGRACDGLLYCVYTQPPERIAPLLAEARAAIGRDRRLVAGFQLFHPQVSDAADLAARVAAARPVVDGINVYNLGLVPPARLGWVAAAVG